jgi:hypothetical protein
MAQSRQSVTSIDGITGTEVSLLSVSAVRAGVYEVVHHSSAVIAAARFGA